MISTGDRKRLEHLLAQLQAVYDRRGQLGGQEIGRIVTAMDRIQKRLNIEPVDAVYAAGRGVLDDLSQFEWVKTAVQNAGKQAA
jgi:hypothetical protein